MILIVTLLVAQGIIAIYLPDRVIYRAILAVFTAVCFFTFVIGMRANKGSEPKGDTPP